MNRGKLDQYRRQCTKPHRNRDTADLDIDYGCCQAGTLWPLPRLTIMSDQTLLWVDAHCAFKRGTRGRVQTPSLPPMPLWGCEYERARAFDARESVMELKCISFQSGDQWHLAFCRTLKNPGGAAWIGGISGTGDRSTSIQILAGLALYTYAGGDAPKRRIVHHKRAQLASDFFGGRLDEYQCDYLTRISADNLIEKKFVSVACTAKSLFASSGRTNPPPLFQE